MTIVPGAALVTGAGVRVGRAMALDLASADWKVAVHFNSSAGPADEVVAEITGLGGKAVAVQADLLDHASCAGLVARASEALGKPLSLLINNASIFEYDTLDTATIETWDRHINSNLRAPVFLTQAFAGQAPTTGTDAAGEPIATGAVINIVDQRVRKLTPEFMTYTIAKMGLWGFTQTAAQALAPRIRVNAIGPGPTLRGGRQSDEHFAAQRAATVLERGSSPADICAAMRFILSAPALTGQLLCMDGGQHLAWQTPDVLGVE